MKDDTVLVLVLAVLLLGDVIAVCFAIWFLFHGQWLSTIASVAISASATPQEPHICWKHSKLIWPPKQSKLNLRASLRAGMLRAMLSRK